MAGIFGPLESFGNSLLGPLTSGFARPTKSTTTAVVAPVTVTHPSAVNRIFSIQTTAQTTTNQPSQTTPIGVVTSAAAVPTATAAAITPITSSIANQSIQPVTSNTDTNSAVTSSASVSASASSITESTISDTATSRSRTASQTTFVTSASTSQSSSIPAAPTNPTNSGNTSNQPQSSNKPSGNAVSPAGIAIGVIVALIIIGAVVYLLCRFCTPLRSWWESWRSQGREKRAYREMIDGPRDNNNETHDEKNLLSSSTTEKQMDPKSFLERVKRSKAPVPEGTGLGLGPVSPIRSHPDFNHTPRSNHIARSSQTSLSSESSLLSTPTTLQSFVEPNRNSIQQTPALALVRKERFPTRPAMQPEQDRASQIGRAVGSPSEAAQTATRLIFQSFKAGSPHQTNIRAR